MSSTSIYALLQHPNVKSSLVERYINFIESCKCDETEYHEDHHVLPASIYPEHSNLKENNWNRKSLSARQHFIAHCMLARMFQKNTPEFFSMVKAFNMMGSISKYHNRNRYVNSRLYEQNRNHMSETMCDLQNGKKNSQHGTCWITSFDLNFKKKISLELINEYYEQGWFISRSKIPYKNSNPKCVKCGLEFISQHTTTRLCYHCSCIAHRVSRPSLKRPIIDDFGKEYASLIDASIEKGVTPEGIGYRIKIGKYHYA